MNWAHETVPNINNDQTQQNRFFPLRMNEWILFMYGHQRGKRPAWITKFLVWNSVKKRVFSTTNLLQLNLFQWNEFRIQTFFGFCLKRHRFIDNFPSHFTLKERQCLGLITQELFIHRMLTINSTIVFMLNTKRNNARYYTWTYRRTAHYFWIDIGWCCCRCQPPRL